MKWIKAMKMAFRFFSLKERWSHALIWLAGLIIINWPGQRITIGIFHSEGYGLFIPTLYGSLINAVLVYSVINHLLLEERSFRIDVLLKTLIFYGGITLIESLVDLFYFSTWIGVVDRVLLQEVLLGNVVLNFLLFYVPAIVYGIIKRALVPDEPPVRIAIQDGHQELYVHPDDLTHVESDGNYVKFHQRDQVTLERNSLVKVADRLPPQFVRCHKSFIVNTDLIDQRSANELMVSGKRIPIGRKFKENLR